MSDRDHQALRLTVRRLIRQLDDLGPAELTQLRRLSKQIRRHLEEGDRQLSRAQERIKP